MGFETLIPAGLNIVSGLIGQDSSRAAANTQADAANRASDLQQKQYEQNRADMEPWRAAGATALGQLTAGTGAGGEFNRDFTLADFNADPGYQFRQQQGMRGVEASAAARGGLLNGGTLKALDRYNQDYASGEYQNAYNRFNNDHTQRFNRLSSLAGTGQTATRDVASVGTQNAQQIGNNVQQVANSRASGYVGGANAVTGGLQSLGNWWQSNNALQQLGKTGGSSYGGGSGVQSSWFPSGDDLSNFFGG